MCKKEDKYIISISGECSSRERIAGSLVLNAANLVTGLRNSNGIIMFSFRYQSDAKLVLRRVSKALTLRPLIGNAMNFNGANAKISKSA